MRTATLSTWLPLLAVLLCTGCSGGASTTPPQPSAPDTITVTSTAFADGRPIPSRYTCHGAGRSPDLTWRGVPSRATSVAVVVSDPDAPRGTFIHWVVYGLPARDATLEAGAPPPGASEADNSSGTRGWYPPCPPSGTHHYHFTVYALTGPPRGSATIDMLDDIRRQAVATGTLTGLVSAG